MDIRLPVSSTSCTRSLGADALAHGKVRSGVAVADLGSATLEIILFPYAAMVSLLNARAAAPLDGFLEDRWAVRVFGERAVDS